MVRKQRIRDTILSNFCFGLGKEWTKLIQIIVNFGLLGAFPDV